MAIKVGRVGWNYTMNKAEQTALHRLWLREQSRALFHATPSYIQFRRMTKYNIMVGCWMIKLNGIYLGIEEDGHTHS